MAKRKADVQSMEEVIKAMIQQNNLKKGMQQISVKETWHELMGAGVSRHTSEVKLQGKTLYVILNSSVLREELSYGKDKIIRMMNEAIGEDLISRLRLM